MHDHERRVHAFALRRSDPASAQDVVAETSAVAWRRRGELPSEPLASRCVLPGSISWRFPPVGP